MKGRCSWPAAHLLVAGGCMDMTTTCEHQQNVFVILPYEVGEGNDSLSKWSCAHVSRLNTIVGEYLAF